VGWGVKALVIENKALGLILSTKKKVQRRDYVHRNGISSLSSNREFSSVCCRLINFQQIIKDTLGKWLWITLKVLVGLQKTMDSKSLRS
jgi:hypothetical protein